MWTYAGGTIGDSLKSRSGYRPSLTRDSGYQDKQQRAVQRLRASDKGDALEDHHAFELNERKETLFEKALENLFEKRLKYFKIT